MPVEKDTEGYGSLKRMGVDIVVKAFIHPCGFQIISNMPLWHAIFASRRDNDFGRLFSKDKGWIRLSQYSLGLQGCCSLLAVGVIGELTGE